METKKQGICTTCHYQRNCSLKTSTLASWDCSEYLPSTIFSSTVATVDYTPQSVSSTSFKGLCGSCDSIGCHWIQPDTVIFHCEHYQ